MLSLSLSSSNVELVSSASKKERWTCPIGACSLCKRAHTHTRPRSKGRQMALEGGFRNTNPPSVPGSKSANLQGSALLRLKCITNEYPSNWMRREMISCNFFCFVLNYTTRRSMVASLKNTSRIFSCYHQLLPPIGDSLDEFIISTHRSFNQSKFISHTCFPP